METRFTSLKEALEYELRDLYNAERQLVAALPKVLDCASFGELKQAISSHLQETRGHVARLERIFEILGVSPGSDSCEAMQGLLEEGEEVMEAQGDARVKDALLIGAAQRIEHYEMAAYGTARAFAQNLGYSDIADILQQTLDEEGAANEKLTSIAEDGWFSTGVNTEARKAANR